MKKSFHETIFLSIQSIPSFRRLVAREEICGNEACSRHHNSIVEPLASRGTIKRRAKGGEEGTKNVSIVGEGQTLITLQL